MKKLNKQPRQRKLETKEERALRILNSKPLPESDLDRLGRLYQAGVIDDAQLLKATW
jgi:hypothetical protein